VGADPISFPGDVAPSQEKQMVFVNDDTADILAKQKQTLSNLHLRKWGCKAKCPPRSSLPETIHSGKRGKDMNFINF